MPQQGVHEGIDVQALRVGDPGEAMRRAPVSATTGQSRFSRTPSGRRSDEERARRHRERAIAAWLRDLAR